MDTQDIASVNIERIGQLFPNCLTERLNENGKPEMAIDFDKLKQELSKEIVEGNQERYQFTWPDKKRRYDYLQVPSIRHYVQNVKKVLILILPAIYILKVIISR